MQPTLHISKNVILLFSCYQMRKRVFTFTAFPQTLKSPADNQISCVVQKQKKLCMFLNSLFYYL